MAGDTRGSYLLARYAAPSFHLSLIALLTAATVHVRLETDQPVWFCLLFPALIAANWVQFMRHPSFVEVTDRAENRVSRYPPVAPDQCTLLRPDAADVHERLLDAAPRYRVTDGVHFCRRCAFQVPAASHHCPLCLRCIRQRDHHCFFLGGCVGGDNMVYFLAFCLHASLGCAVAALTLGAHLHAHLLPLGSVRGVLYLLLPPAAMVAWALGELAGGALALVVLIYLATTTSLGTAAMLAYHATLIGTGRVAHMWAVTPHVTPAAHQFRRVFGRCGLLHLLLPVNRRPYPALSDAPGDLEEIKVL